MRFLFELNVVHGLQLRLRCFGSSGILCCLRFTLVPLWNKDIAKTAGSQAAVGCRVSREYHLITCKPLPGRV